MAGVRETATLLTLLKRLRACRSSEEAALLIVNETRQIVALRSAILWRRRGGGGKIAAISSIPQATAGSPFSQWCQRLCRHLQQDLVKNEAQPIARDTLPAAIAAEWDDYLAAEAILLPLQHDENNLGLLIIVRDTPFTAAELMVLQHWGEAVGHHLGGAVRDRWQPRTLSPRWRRMTAAVIILSLFAFLLLYRVNLFVLANGEVTPINPLVIRSPLEGVIKTIPVRANQRVEAGDLLVELDDAPLQSRLESARKELDIAQTELRRAKQSGIVDQQAQSQIPLLQARVDQRMIDVTYLQQLLSRVNIVAERPGVVVVDNVHDLIGKPVVIGERILMVADPAQVELTLWIPAADMIPLAVGSTIQYFQNVDPDRPVSGELLSHHYLATESPDGLLAFRAYARIDTPLRPGLRGVARLEGEEVRLIYLIFRRPWATLRQWLGR
jgi:hypothetical protein